MKKIFLLVACAFMAAGVCAQPKLGVKAGLNLASISNTDDESIKSKMKPSFYAGVFADFQVLDFMAISPELLYSRQGFYKKSSGEGETYKMWYRTNYLNIPVMVKFTFVEGLSIDVGPQFGFNLNGKMKEKWEYDGESGDEKTSTSNAIKTFDFGMNFGVSYMITEKIDVAARYNLGFTEIRKINTSKDSHHNGVLQIGVGYRF